MSSSERRSRGRLAGTPGRPHHRRGTPTSFPRETVASTLRHPDRSREIADVSCRRASRRCRRRPVSPRDRPPRGRRDLGRGLRAGRPRTRNPSASPATSITVGASADGSIRAPQSCRGGAWPGGPSPASSACPGRPTLGDDDGVPERSARTGARRRHGRDAPRTIACGPALRDLGQIASTLLVASHHAAAGRCPVSSRSSVLAGTRPPS